MAAHDDAAKLEALLDTVGAQDYQRRIIRRLLHHEPSQRFIPGPRHEPVFFNPMEFEPFYADDQVYDVNGNAVMDEAATMPITNVSDLLRNATFEDVLRSAQRLMDQQPQTDTAKKYPNAIDVGEITHKPDRTEP